MACSGCDAREKPLMILLVRIASRVGGNLAEDGTELEIPHLGCPWGVKCS
jgi:hypothetical protein